MGSETVIFILLAVIVGLGIFWRDENRDRKAAIKKADTLSEEFSRTRTQLDEADKRNIELEAEIQRLRKIPLTESKKKTDNSIVKARSAADVRRITETAFGKQPEIGETNGA